MTLVAVIGAALAGLLIVTGLVLFVMGTIFIGTGIVASAEASFWEIVKLIMKYAATGLKKAFDGTLPRSDRLMGAGAFLLLIGVVVLIIDLFLIAGLSAGEDTPGAGGDTPSTTTPTPSATSTSQS